MTAPRWFIDCEREHDPDKPGSTIELDWTDFQTWLREKRERVSENQETQ